MTIIITTPTVEEEVVTTIIEGVAALVLWKIIHLSNLFSIKGVSAILSFNSVLLYFPSTLRLI